MLRGHWPQPRLNRCLPSHTRPVLVAGQAAQPGPATTGEDARQRLKQLSDERSSRWPNTLQVTASSSIPTCIHGETHVLAVHWHSMPSPNALPGAAKMRPQAQHASREQARAERAAREEAERVKVRACSPHRQTRGIPTGGPASHLDGPEQVPGLSSSMFHRFREITGCRLA
jgi:hypothetical protein